MGLAKVLGGRWTSETLSVRRKRIKKKAREFFPGPLNHNIRCCYGQIGARAKKYLPIPPEE
jgi:hypothetical protein